MISTFFHINECFGTFSFDMDLSKPKPDPHPADLNNWLLVRDCLHDVTRKVNEGIHLTSFTPPTAE